MTLKKIKDKKISKITLPKLIIYSKKFLNISLINLKLKCMNLKKNFNKIHLAVKL